MKSLSMCKVGEVLQLEEIEKGCPEKIKRRLLELGFTRGQGVKVEKKSVLGKVFLVQIRGYILSIRKDLLLFVRGK